MQLVEWLRKFQSKMMKKKTKIWLIALIGVVLGIIVGMLKPYVVISSKEEKGILTKIERFAASDKSSVLLRDMFDVSKKFTVACLFVERDSNLGQAEYGLHQTFPSFWPKGHNYNSNGRFKTIIAFTDDSFNEVETLMLHRNFINSEQGRYFFNASEE